MSPRNSWQEFVCAGKVEKPAVWLSAELDPRDPVNEESPTNTLYKVVAFSILSNVEQL
jgi:hypothetical protein